MHTTLPTFKEIENSIGGRPKKKRKIRLSFYLTPQENDELRSLSFSTDISVSTLVRKLIIKHLLP